MNSVWTLCAWTWLKLTALASLLGAMVVGGLNFKVFLYSAGIATAACLLAILAVYIRIGMYRLGIVLPSVDLVPDDSEPSASLGVNTDGTPMLTSTTDISGKPFGS